MLIQKKILVKKMVSFDWKLFLKYNIVVANFNLFFESKIKISKIIYFKFNINFSTDKLHITLC